MPGNVGDALLEWAAFSLMKDFGVAAEIVSTLTGPGDAEEIVIAA